MKHLFSVHSPITFLSAYGTIKYLGLDNSEVIIMSSNYKVLIDDYKVIPSFEEVKNKTLFQKIKYFNVPKAYDNYIASVIGNQDFIAYIDLVSYKQRNIITHKNCRAFHFLEEGNSTYQQYDDLEDLTWQERHIGWRNKGIFDFYSLLRIMRGYNLRMLSMPYIYMAYANIKGIQFFSISKNAYVNIKDENRVVLKFENNDPNIEKLAGGYAYQHQTIWLDGSNARYTGLDESYYHQAIHQAIPILKAKEVIKDKVYVKLRPGIKDVDSNQLVAILKFHGIEVEVMPNDMIIEAFLIQSSKCHVIGVMTSVLEYAHVFGHKAYSIYSLFEKQPPTFFDRMTGMWENIERLKPIS